jgi:hypothetical protein
LSRKNCDQRRGHTKFDERGDDRPGLNYRYERGEVGTLRGAALTAISGG